MGSFKVHSDEMNIEEANGSNPSSATEYVDVDDTPDFIDMNDAVEVNVDNENIPMDDEDEDVAEDNVAAEDGTTDAMGTTEASHVVDMSKHTFDSHTDSIFAVACHLEVLPGNTVPTLLCVSGGGDDKSFLHRLQGMDTTGSSSQFLRHAHTDSVSCVALNLRHVSSDLTKTPRLVAVGSFDGAIVIYNPDTGEKLQTLEGPSDVEWISFHPKGGSVLLAGSGDGTVWMFHIPLKKCLQVFVGHEQGVTAGSFTPDGKWALTASADGTLRQWAPKTGMSKHVFRFPSAQGQDGAAGLTCLATNGGNDGQLVLVGGENGMAYVCHVGPTKKIVASLRHFELPTTAPNDDEADEDIEYPMSVEAVGFSPLNPNWCATAGVDGVLKIWDLTVDGGQCRQTCRTTTSDTNGQDQDIEGNTRLTWHPSLPVVITATSRGNIHLWDSRNGNKLHTVTGHTETINAMDIQFLDNGSAIIVSGGDDKTVRIFEVDVPALLQP